MNRDLFYTTEIILPTRSQLYDLKWLSTCLLLITVLSKTALGWDDFTGKAFAVQAWHPVFIPETYLKLEGESKNQQNWHECHRRHVPPPQWQQQQQQQ